MHYASFREVQDSREDKTSELFPSAGFCERMESSSGIKALYGFSAGCILPLIRRDDLSIYARAVYLAQDLRAQLSRVWLPLTCLQRLMERSMTQS